MTPQAVEGGATVLFGDGDMTQSSKKPGVGYYVSPTILSGLSDGDEAWDSEIFGPVIIFFYIFIFLCYSTDQFFNYFVVFCISQQCYCILRARNGV